MLKASVPVDGLSNALCCAIRDLIEPVQVREPLSNPPPATAIQCGRGGIPP
jgi:hypothetical protein